MQDKKTRLTTLFTQVLVLGDRKALSRRVLLIRSVWRPLACLDVDVLLIASVCRAATCHPSERRQCASPVLQAVAYRVYELSLMVGYGWVTKSLFSIFATKI